jgi:RNA polymerase sigma-70 factor, ECF subfamily
VVRREHDGPGDDVLVAAVVERSHEALAEIYRRHGGAVWSIAKQVCGAEHAEEVCQAVFTELWSQPERFDPSRGSLRSWLVAQAHSRAVVAARAAAEPPRRDVGEPQVDVGLEVAAQADGLAKEARRALDQLPPSEREAILLAYLGGRACSETARLLGVLEGSVKSHIRSGLLNLRLTLAVEGVTGDQSHWPD